MNLDEIFKEVCILSEIKTPTCLKSFREGEGSGGIEERASVCVCVCVAGGSLRPAAPPE